MRDVLALTRELMARPSVTPDDAGCLELLAPILEAAGLVCERMDRGGVSNLWAVSPGDGPVLCFAGHTDVVPPGDASAWTSPPFEPTERDGLLYGRGACDMKAAVAAMVAAVEAEAATAAPLRLALLLTSDEEGPAVDGTRHVVGELAGRAAIPDFAVVGEPSSAGLLGDRIRVGRRGSLTGTITLRGTQGHVAYPEKVRNAIHIGVGLLDELASTVWDEGAEGFPPTSFQWVDLRSGVADNVVPGELSATFNLRYSPALTAAEIRAHVEERLLAMDLDADLSWRPGAAPFHTEDGPLREVTAEAIRWETSVRTQADCGGGTSDGRFLAEAGAAVVELGHVNRSIHAVDEHVELEDVPKLAAVYATLIRKLRERVA